MEENSTGDPILDRLKKIQIQLDHIREKGQKTREEIRSFRHNVKTLLDQKYCFPVETTLCPLEQIQDLQVEPVPIAVVVIVKKELNNDESSVQPIGHKRGPLGPHRAVNSEENKVQKQWNLLWKFDRNISSTAQDDFGGFRHLHKKKVKFKGLQDRQKLKNNMVNRLKMKKLRFNNLKRVSLKMNTPRHRKTKKMKINQTNRQWSTLRKSNTRFESYTHIDDFGSSSYKFNRKVKMKGNFRNMKPPRTPLCKCVMIFARSRSRVLPQSIEQQSVVDQGQLQPLYFGHDLVKALGYPFDRGRIIPSKLQQSWMV